MLGVALMGSVLLQGMLVLWSVGVAKLTMCADGTRLPVWVHQTIPS
jgi:hypothetical protein